MPTTLRVERRSVGIASVELHRSSFQVLLDDRPIGSVDRDNKTVELPVPPGPHQLQVRSGRYCSPARSFEAAEGQTVQFRCTGAIFWPRFLVSLAKPDLAIVLERAPD